MAVLQLSPRELTWHSWVRYVVRSAVLDGEVNGLYSRVAQIFCGHLGTEYEQKYWSAMKLDRCLFIVAIHHSRQIGMYVGIFQLLRSQPGHLDRAHVVGQVLDEIAVVCDRCCVGRVKFGEAEI